MIRPPYVQGKLYLQRGDSGMKYTPRHTKPGQILDFIQLQYSQMYGLKLTFEAKEAVATSDYHRCGCLLHKWRKWPGCYPCSLLESGLFPTRCFGTLTKRVVQAS
jgi:hypothetical protein